MPPSITDRRGPWRIQRNRWKGETLGTPAPRPTTSRSSESNSKGAELPALQRSQIQKDIGKHKCKGLLVGGSSGTLSEIVYLANIWPGIQWNLRFWSSSAPACGKWNISKAFSKPKSLFRRIYFIRKNLRMLQIPTCSSKTSLHCTALSLHQSKIECFINTTLQISSSESLYGSN